MEALLTCGSVDILACVASRCKEVNSTTYRDVYSSLILIVRHEELADVTISTLIFEPLPFNRNSDSEAAVTTP